MKQLNDVSFGIIPVRKQAGEWEVFLIHQYSRRGDTYWVFPKGHPLEGEEPLTAAKRELAEETGLETVSVIASPTFTLTYQFSFEDTAIHKTVTFFLASVTDVPPMLQEAEVKEAAWLSLKEAMNRLTHAQTRFMFEGVVMYLQDHPDCFIKLTLSQ